jgi:hypothetical protein
MNCIILLLLWTHHEKSPERDERDGRVTMRMSTVLLLNTIPVSHIQTQFKSPTFVCLCKILVTDKVSNDTEIDSGTDIICA